MITNKIVFGIIICASISSQALAEFQYSVNNCEEIHATAGAEQQFPNIHLNCTYFLKGYEAANGGSILPGTIRGEAGSDSALNYEFGTSVLPGNKGKEVEDILKQIGENDIEHITIPNFVYEQNGITHIQEPRSLTIIEGLNDDQLNALSGLMEITDGVSMGGLDVTVDTPNQR